MGTDNGILLYPVNVSRSKKVCHCIIVELSRISVVKIRVKSRDRGGGRDRRRIYECRGPHQMGLAIRRIAKFNLQRIQEWT
jgi:hypothetical protein